MSHPKSDNATLARNIGLFSLIVYGVGDMVGAGIYGTIGKAAGELGNAVWMSFVVSMVAALLTGLSYASLASRYPKAGGAAYVVNRAYRLRFLAYVVGLTVAASGLTSMATGSNVLGDTVISMVAPYRGPQLAKDAPPEQVSADTEARAAHKKAQFIPQKLVVVGFLLLLAGINFIGIRESLTANLICTAVEVGGLILVIAVGARYLGSVNYLELPVGKTLSAPLILTGAVLTFYAFVGFEDMLNVSEEVKDPERNMPIGIVAAIVVATVVYLLVSLVAVSVVPAANLADTAGKGPPLTQVMSVAAPWMQSWVFTGISIFAVANTALLNYVMGSRLLYGMAKQGLVPGILGTVHAKRRTPHVAIAVLGLIVLALAFVGNVSQLASATSLLLLSCFCLVNIALVILKTRSDEPKGRMEIPSVIPILGAIVCLGLIGVRVFDAIKPGVTPEVQRAPLIALALILLIAALYLVLRPKGEALEEGL